MHDTPRRLVKTVCPLDCPDTCALVATLEDGRVVGLAGDADHPYTRGVICRKMRRYPERLYSRDRILHPLKRTGRKGEGRFTPIGWDEAYAILTERITATCRQFGGAAILPFVYAGNMGAINRFAGYPLFNKLGTSRLEETICSAAAKAGWHFHCGDVPGTPPEVAEEAELIVIWGSNTKVTNMHFWPYVAAARRKGALLVVIDPYRNATAQSADLHLQVAPAGDSALTLALLKLLLRKDAVDHAFIASSTSGFDALRRYVEDTPLQDFLAASGLEQSVVQDFADLLQERRKTFIRIGIGMTRNARAGMSVRGITSLAAALGLFDGAPGRGVLLTSAAFSGDTSLLAWPSLAVGERRTFNMVQLGNCLHKADPPIRMLMVYNANPLSVTPDGSLVRQALLREELFTVVHEQVMTPTARHADLLLPATTFLENRDLYSAYGHFYLSVADAAIEPLGQAKSNFTFFQELAARLGFTDEPFRETLDERLGKYLRTLRGLPEGIDAATVAGGASVRSTRWSRGQAAFAGDRERFAFRRDDDPTQPGIVCLTPGGEGDNVDYAARYPFRLITPPHRELLNSTFGERYAGHPGEVLIHPEDARASCVKDEELVTLYNGRGWTRRKARVSDATRPGLLVAEGLFWQCEGHPTAINDLTSQKLTDIGGGGTFHDARVAIMSCDVERRGDRS